MADVKSNIATVDFEKMHKEHEELVSSKRYRYFLRYWWWLVRTIKEIPYIPRKIKWLFQRAFRGYADCDAWGLDWYLTKVAIGGLQQIRDGIGYPQDMTQAKWDRYLDTTIKWLREYHEFEEDTDAYRRMGRDAYYKEWNKRHRNYLKAWKRIAERIDNLWD